MSLIVRSLTLALAAALAAGCGSSQSTSQGSSPLDRVVLERSTSPVFESLDPRFDVVPSPDGASYSFIFSAGASGTSDSPDMRALRSIGSVTFTVYDVDGRAVDSMTTTDVSTSGVQNAEGSASLTATARVEWTPTTPMAPGARAVMRASAPDGVIVRVAEMPPLSTAATSRREPLALSLVAEERGTMMEFVLTVERTGPPRPDEYMPSGERYRIEIFNDRGERVWSSSSGQMFTQAIGPVVPERVGEKVVYRAMFNGVSDETHARLEPGRYRVVASVPAQPRPYTVREEMTWSR